MQERRIEPVDRRFSYSVKYPEGVNAHDFDSEIRRQPQPEIRRFQRLLRRIQWFGRLNRPRRKLLNALNPFNYLSVGAMLDLGGFSRGFSYKILKPLFVNFRMATNMFDLPAALFSLLISKPPQRKPRPMAHGASMRKCWPASRSIFTLADRFET